MDLFRQAFHDIVRGCSWATIAGVQCYIKHLSYRDQVDYELKRDLFFNEAKDEGLHTNESRLAEMRAEGSWSDAKDQELDDLRVMLDGLYEAKRSQKMPSLAKAQAAKIKEHEKTYHEKLNDKATLIGLSCEVHAEREINDYYIYTNLFRDETLREPLYSAAQFDQLSDKTVGTIVADYNRALEPVAPFGLKKLAMQPFFQEYIALSGDRPADFFGKAICHLTFFQLKTLSYGKYYLHLFQNHDTSKFPKDVMEDPDLFADYASSVSKGKEEMQKQGVGAEGAIVVGVKAEDAKALGVKPQNNIIADMARSGGNVLDYLQKRGAL